MIQEELSCSTFYNALPNSFEADQSLTSAGRDEVLRGLSEVLVRHGLHDDIGIRLLHKHNDIAASEIMIEREEFDGDEFCLATIASPLPERGEAVFAHSWIMSGAEPVAVEFSTDELVGEKASKLDEHPQFLADFKGALDALGMSGLLGPCVLDRTFHARHRPLDPSRDCLVEAIDEARRANILRYRPVSRDGSLIDTVWRAREFVVPPDVTMGCEKQTTTKTVCQWSTVISCERESDGSHKTTSKNQHKDVQETTTIHTFTPG